MGRHTATDGMSSWEKAEMIAEMLDGISHEHLIFLQVEVECKMEEIEKEVLEMRQRNHSRRVRRLKKRLRLIEEEVSEDSENSQSYCIAGQESCDEDYGDEEDLKLEEEERNKKELNA